MISVAILINGNPLMARSAVNTGNKLMENSAEFIYAVDDGSIVLHDPDEGAAALAIKLLETIKE